MTDSMNENIQKKSAEAPVSVALTPEEARAAKDVADALLLLQMHADYFPPSIWRDISDSMADARISEMPGLPINERAALITQQARCLILTEKARRLTVTQSNDPA